MAHSKRTRKSPARQVDAKEPMATSRGGTLALFATLALSLGTAIAAAAWLIATHETTGMTATRMTMPDASDRPAAITAPAAQVTPTADATGHLTASAAVTPTATPASASAADAGAGAGAAVPSATMTASSPAAQPPAPTPAPAAPSAAGQRAFIDPVTGELRQPEHEELAAIAAQAAAAAPASRSAARTASVATASFGPDGSVDAVVPEDLHTFTVATRGPDGRIVIEHAQGQANAAKLVKANGAKKGPQAPVSRAQQKEDRNDR
jgi:hypothetical protein